VFSGLVAAWAARGKADNEREALEWLERQPPPQIVAAAAAARPAPISFVPPNDKLQKTGGASWRSRQPRRFPAALPDERFVRLIWPEALDAPVDALDAISRDLAYVGHSASLTRCTFRWETTTPASASPARRRIYAGRLKELEAAFQSRRRPSPGDVVAPPPRPQVVSANTFSPDWLTFEILSGAPGSGGLDVRAAPLACKALIKTVMSGYEAAAGPAAIPAWVSGHEADGSPVRTPHLAAVPLLLADFEHADGRLMGLALVPPDNRADLLADASFRRALLHVSRQENGRRIARLTLGRYGELRIALSESPERPSLDPRRYARRSRIWATVTPLVLDRHLKGRSGEALQDEMEALIAEACERSVGVRPVRVVAGKHSAVTGAPSAYPSGKAPRWTGWRTPEALGSRRLVHAIIDFGVDAGGVEREVAGPILIGAGRFCGLGLCLPLNGGNG
jgi:CRISPR-associated protein Csb2